MKIKFFLSDNEMAPTTISGKLFATALIKRDYDVEIVTSYERKREIIDKEDADIIIFQKKIYPGHTYADVHPVKGKIFLCYIDDDFAGMNAEKYKKTLREADLVLVANKFHAEKMKEYVETPIEVITSISDFENYNFVGINEKNNSPLIIAWQQNLADVYIEDLRSISKPLSEIYDKYKIQLKLYGWHEGKHYGVPDNRDKVRSFLPFAEFIPFKILDDYLKYIVPDISKSDIGIVPYVNIEDRYGKGGYSLRKMMMMGIPMVTSNFGVNKELIKDGVNGFLASDEDEWYRKLEELILDKKKREEFAIKSRSFLEKNFMYEKTVDVFIDAISKHFKLTK